MSTESAPEPSIAAAAAPQPAPTMGHSGGGVALQLPPMTQSPPMAEFVIGATVDDCTLRLPDADPITLSLEVRNISHNTQRSGAELLRLGCRFSQLSRSSENIIQRYIFNTERERNARERGGI